MSDSLGQDWQRTTEETPDVAKLAVVTPQQFGHTIPSLVDFIRYRIRHTPENASHTENVERTKALILTRMSEEPTVNAITEILVTPITDRDSLYTFWAAFGLVSDLSPLQFGPFRNVVTALTKLDTRIAPDGISLNNVKSHAIELLRFMDNPTDVWVATHKGDSMFDRSLTERVHSAEEMTPFVKDLLHWLADLNWPPAAPCAAQLARFPEATIEPIKTIFRTEKDDLEWLQRIIEFVESHVPIGEMWEELRPEITQRINPDAKGEEEQNLSEAATEWAKILNDWKAQHDKSSQ